MPQGHIFDGDFDLVITVYSHSYLAMDAVYGPAGVMGSNNGGVIGAPPSNEQGYRGLSGLGQSMSDSVDGDGTSKFPGLAEPGLKTSGGYEWPAKGDGHYVDCSVLHSRFTRQGNTLRQRYYKGSSSDNTPVPSADSDWSDVGWPVASPGYATLATGDEVVITAGEASTSPCNVGSGACSCSGSWSNVGQFHVNLFSTVVSTHVG